MTIEYNNVAKNNRYCMTSIDVRSCTNSIIFIKYAIYRNIIYCFKFKKKLNSYNYDVSKIYDVIK